MTPNSMQFSFGIIRMLAAIAVCAAALAIARPLGELRIVGAAFIGIPLALMTLFARKSDIRPMLRMLCYCGLGAFVGINLGMDIKHPGEAFKWGIVGAFGGVVCAFVARQFAQVRQESRQDD